MVFTYPPVIGDSTLYNPRFYPSLGADGVLTYEYAQTLYLNKNDYRMSYLSGVIPGAATSGSALVLDETLSLTGLGAVSCSSLTVGGVAVGTLPSFLDGITPGTAANNKALVLGPSGEIAGINRISLQGVSTTAGTFETLLSLTNADASPAIAAIQLKVGAASASECFIGTTSALTKTVIMVGGARVITCESTGNVSIGGSTTTYKLNVGGTINCTNLYRSDTVVDLPLISGITTIGTGQASKALTLDASRNAINIASIACDTIIANSTTNILNINPTTLQIKGVALTATATQLNVLNGYTGTTANLNILSGTTATSADLTKLAGITSTAAELNYLDLTTGPGTAQASKALVLNSSSGITGIATLSTTGDITIGGVINGFLAYGNQASITSLGSLTELGINATPADEYFSITGSGADYLDSSYTRMLTFRGSNISPVQFQIEVNNGTNATSTNATWIGNYSANDIRFGTNQTTRMTLTNGGRLGIGTTLPNAPLQVSSVVSYTWNSNNSVGTSVYRLRTDSGATETATGSAITYTNVAGIFLGYIGCEAMVMQSDHRLKQEIVDVPIARVECLYKSVAVKSYRWKKHPDKPKELGLIAQDVLSEGFVDLIARIPDNDTELEQSSDPWLEPKGVKLNIDYSKLSVYNMRMIQELLDRIDELRAIISE